MPIYEYRCDACGHDLEVLQKMNDPVLRKCPECKKLKLKKLVSAAAFRLKGGGWYETDFKTGKKKNVADDKSSSDSAATTSKPAASDSAPKSDSTKKTDSASSSKSSDKSSTAKPSAGKTKK